MSCLCCGNSLTAWSSIGSHHCVRCGYTGLDRIEPNPYPTDGALAAHYVNLDNTPESRALSALRLTTLRMGGVSRGLVLDFGCATGAFLVAARSYGYDVAGVECSPVLCEVARSKSLRILTQDLGALDGVFSGASAITLFDVLEHIPDAKALLKKARTLLLREGLLVISTPDASGLAESGFAAWRHFKPREHPHYFTVGALSALLLSCGYEVTAHHRLESEIRLDPARPHGNILTICARPA